MEFIIVLILFCLLCAGVVAAFKFFSYKSKDTPKLDKHIQPYYWRYHGGFWNVNKCVDCGRTAMHEDMHQVNPCPECGGKVKQLAPGKWQKKDGLYQWVLKS